MNRPLGGTILDIWNYGTEGYIIPNNWREQFKDYTILSDLTYDKVEEFFKNIYARFWVKGELDELYLLGYNLDSVKIREEINIID